MLQTINFTLQPAELAAQLTEHLTKSRQRIKHLATQSHPSWDNFILPMDALGDELSQFWSPVGHLNSVCNSEALREAYNACLPLLSDYYTDLGQNADLFAAYQRLQTRDDFAQLSASQQRIIELALRDFRMSGIDLNAADKKTYKKIAARLSEISTQYENHIIDASKAWSKLIADPKQLQGVPAPRLQAMQDAAKAKQQTGYLATLDFPCYYDIVTYADNASLREELYQAYCTRASDQGPNAGEFDNGPLMLETLQLRQQLASLLGYANYADMSLVPKMAESAEQVDQFLQNLAKKVSSKAKQDITQLQEFSGRADLQSWDVAYYSEKLREEKYAISQETLKTYFPTEHVLSGLFGVIKKLYGIELRAKDLPNLWHADVQYFELYKGENIIGAVFMDLYARENKRQGAWMDGAISRHKLADGTIQLPIAYLTCNFAGATSETPALLTHGDVETLFHEMGHCLQHLLTEVEHLEVSGINNVPWDTVEFPSQFFESWAWQPESLRMLSKHYQTGECLPDEMIEKLIAAKNFQAGLFLIRQAEFALFDIAIHKQAKLDDSFVYDTLNAIRAQISVIKPPAYNRFANSFSHIFAGGYAAGYYSYLWAEVLARDAFSAFADKGLFDAELGDKFRSTVLALGGSEKPEIIFEKFMGRAPDDEALLQAYGF
jgi:oligopeptidase A